MSLVTLLSLSTGTVSAQEEHLENVNFVKYEGGEHKTTSNYTANSSRDTINLEVNNDALELGLTISGVDDSIEIEAKMFHSEIDEFNDVIIGDAVTVKDGYELSTLRIEKNASNFTLLEPNLHMEGESVLSIGVRDTSNGDVYYTQQMLEGDMIDEMNTQTNYSNSSDSEIDKLIALELDYLFFTETSENDVETIESTEDIYEEDVNVSKLSESSTKMNSEYDFLDYRVDPERMKGEVLERWVNVDSGRSHEAPYRYTYIAFNVAGTENTITYLVFRDMIYNFDYDAEDFIYSVVIRYNDAIAYNAYDNELLLWEFLENELVIDDPTLSLQPNETDSFIWGRYTSGITTGSRLENYARVALSYVPLGSRLASHYDYLTDPAQTVTGNLFTWYDTIEGQLAAYDGLNSRVTIDADGETLQYPGDYLLLRVYTKGIGTSMQTVDLRTCRVTIFGIKVGR
ncbi:hypothetical protein JCM19037_1284 [Geomicrobium sp. JCM 19037]|uniref:hypothetical protein n=1 Tax=Geomicrobium sp. JCM 19037 TaxID=1460634 RepID=UPI00045F45B2|nr:hypothetical protein [Geomicrobium sp. JCM 19037]GAK03007.1 hypothetical protein JCM19037_1284 [Geomicrobium sp. JCM 19037]